MILAADKNDVDVGRDFPFEVLCERHTCESASDDNYPSFTHRSTSVLLKRVITHSIVFAQSFFEFGLCGPIAKQRLLKLMIGFGERRLRLQHIGKKRCR